MSSFAILVSGLPGSGKTTIGKKIAEELGIAALDKDEFLEALFETRGIGDQSHRRELSRQADRDFERAASQLDAAVLISHWQPDNIKNTGTPTDWVTNSFDRVVELSCVCDVSVATDRFLARDRHPGHLDDLRPEEETREWMLNFERSYPLGIGDLISVSTERDFDIVPLAKAIKRQLS